MSWRKASAWYQVVYSGKWKLGESALSFAWILHDVLCAIKRARRV